VLHETIQLVQVDICKHLTRDIPYGDSNSSLSFEKFVL
jgi:hypothetical protein